MFFLSYHIDIHVVDIHSLSISDTEHSVLLMKQSQRFFLLNDPDFEIDQNTFVFLQRPITEIYWFEVWTPQWTGTLLIRSIPEEMFR
ncbi:hypothetical protein NPIL_163471 [Nephila pilipes]|uniref:Uncharacterized protein n=1 Tax=Nephila pilipes TaxID=299642 RepID=A0A8X6U8H9_NEPPI|nr:hypothetical protein NPIL_163471 [Nephila pilipes]